ncbi:hypothetical protein [Lysinibacillus sp. NPDC096212]|uniref:hypothetical protein n=1 Tax=Lysinibacillus sp. NPDC096212 TaxID=3364135 RepID=UPI0037FE348D
MGFGEVMDRLSKATDIIIKVKDGVSEMMDRLIRATDRKGKVVDRKVKMMDKTDEATVGTIEVKNRSQCDGKNRRGDG